MTVRITTGNKRGTGAALQWIHIEHHHATISEFCVNVTIQIIRTFWSDRGVKFGAKPGLEDDCGEKLHWLQLAWFNWKTPELRGRAQGYLYNFQ